MSDGSWAAENVERHSPLLALHRSGATVTPDI